MPSAPIPTPRLLLLPATAAALDAELDSPAALGAALGADVPAEWPPELYDAAAVRWTRDLLRSTPEAEGWSSYYLAERPAAAGGRPRLVGVGGYRGPPNADGEVEVGYSVLPAFRRRGYAREAFEAWLARAFADPRVARVVAHTLPELAPSIGVLERTGFTLLGPAADPDEPTAIRFAVTRGEYAARGA